MRLFTSAASESIFVHEHGNGSPHDECLDILEESLWLLERGKVPAIGMLTVPNEVVLCRDPGRRRGHDLQRKVRITERFTKVIAHQVELKINANSAHDIFAAAGASTHMSVAID